MKKVIKTLCGISILIIVTMTYFGCELDSKGKGNLDLFIESDIQGTDISSYDIDLTGPENETIHKRTYESETAFHDLTEGLWGITVSANDADGTLAGQGTDYVTIKNNETVTKIINITPNDPTPEPPTPPPTETPAPGPPHIKAEAFDWSTGGTKGTAGAHINIMFSNSGTGYDFFFKVKIRSNTYSDWDSWLMETYSNTIASGTASQPTYKSVTITLPHHFVSGNNDPQTNDITDRYALNTGNYQITGVHTWWQWASGYESHTAYPRALSFAIDPSEGAHKIFTVVYYDDDFTSMPYIAKYEGASKFFDYAVSHSAIVEDVAADCSATDDFIFGGLETLKNVEYIGLFRNRDATSDLDSCSLLNELRTEARYDLGLRTTWYASGASTGILTSNHNHGFDLFVGLTGTGPGSGGGGCAYFRGNGAVMCARDWFADEHEGAALLLVHELSHNFGAYDLEPDLCVVPPETGKSPIYSVMSIGQLHPFYKDRPNGSRIFVYYKGSVDEMECNFRN
jgi:hypothetical protein